MSRYRRQLAQLRPSGTSAEVLFNPGTNKPYTIDTIVVTNVAGGGNSVDICIFHDIDGTTYDESTAVVWNYTLAHGGTKVFDIEISDYQKTSNVAVKISIANAANFTAYGIIEGEIS